MVNFMADIYSMSNLMHLTDLLKQAMDGGSCKARGMAHDRV